MPIVQEWNNDHCEDNSSQIIEIDQNEESDDDDCIADNPVKKITASEAIEIIDKALQWAGEAMVDQSDMNTLRRLREKAVFQLLEKKKQQKKITDFFNG